MRLSPSSVDELHRAARKSTRMRGVVEHVVTARRAR
jgi:hypothetical protein